MIPAAVPQDAGYYHAAYIVAATLYGLYIVSLVWRTARVRDRLRRRKPGGA